MKFTLGSTNIIVMCAPYGVWIHFFADFLHRREAILVLIGYEFRKEDRHFYAKFLLLSMHKILPREHTYKFYGCSRGKILCALHRRDFA